VKYIMEIKSLHNIQGIDYNYHQEILHVIIRIIYFSVHGDPDQIIT